MLEFWLHIGLLSVKTFLKELRPYRKKEDERVDRFM